MGESEKNSKDIFNRMIRAGRRTYFVAVRESKNNQKYITVTESKLVEKDKFDRYSIMFFPEKVGEFVQALQEAQQVAV
jgi:hypothetical protein